MSVEEPIVNVASVPQLSPFRYPGGKTWLVPHVTRWLRNLPKRPRQMIDPFTGGGSVPLAALSEGLVDRLVLCELDTDVAAVWKVVFSADAGRLCGKILDFDITREHVLQIVSSVPQSLLDKAFRTIVKNRTFRGGILADGASLVNVGENGRGVASRWYPETLVRRIRSLQTLSAQVTVVEGDGLDVIQHYDDSPSTVFFADPPYTAGNGKRAGKRLYRHYELDHQRLFKLLSKMSGPVMLTYDDDPYVMELAEHFGFQSQRVPMKNTHHRCMYELVITRF